MTLRCRRAQRALITAVGLVLAAPWSRSRWRGTCFIPGGSHMAASAAGHLSMAGPDGFGDLPSLLLAFKKVEEQPGFEIVGPQSGYGLFVETEADLGFYLYIIGFLGLAVFCLWWATKESRETGARESEINKIKMKMITQADSATPLDQFRLSRLFIGSKDYSSALAEMDEVEEDFTDVRETLDPDDTIAALALRAQLHNSKGYALMKLEPPKVAQARREFVRAVTYWPEYPQALLNIGEELIKRKRYDVALRTFNSALRWLPGSVLIRAAADKAQRGLDGQLGDDTEDQGALLSKRRPER